MDLKHPQTMEIALQNIRNAIHYNDQSIDLVVGLFSRIRPTYYGDYQKAEKKLWELISVLKNDPTTLRKLRYLMTRIVLHSEILEIFTTSGIEMEPNFFVELRSRLKHKILPAQRDKKSLLRVIDTIFYKSTDIQWIEKIDLKLWNEFFTLLRLQVNFTDSQTLEKLNESLHIVSCRIVTLGMNKEIREWLLPDEIPFFTLQNRLSQNILSFSDLSPVVEQKYDLIRDQLNRALKACHEALQRIREQSVSDGTSLQQTHLLKQVFQLIDRMYIILEISSDRGNSVASSRLITLFEEIVRNENKKNSLRELFRSNIRVLAYRIAEHGHDTGEHYITTSRKQYFTMFKSAMGGGVFAAFMALIKCFLHKITLAPFWQGFAYSINYSAGFVGIHLTGSTLATKQPAMTASAIASAMDKNKNVNSMSQLAILLSKVWRSQTASFVGNLLIAFPVALAVAALYRLIAGIQIVEGEHAQELLDWQNPLRSHCLFYACNTGIFLYVSGLVTGFFDNRVIHGHIPERIEDHPFLNRFFRKGRIHRFAKFVEKNAGPVIGNVFLGFCLGMAGFFGYIFGIDFDIRHITISTGQFAIGLQGLNYQVPRADVIMTVAGILLIGFLNFAVSFSLAFVTASISRGVQIQEYSHLFTYLRRLIVRYPFDFIYPPKNGRKPEDLLKKDKIG